MSNPALVLAGDITDEPFVKQAFERAKSHFGRCILLLIVRQNTFWHFLIALCQLLQVRWFEIMRRNCVSGVNL